MIRLARIGIVLGLILHGASGFGFSEKDYHLESSESRNGGYGIYIDGTLVSLDLAMRGVHDDPYAPAGTYSLTEEEDELVHYLLRPIADQNIRDRVVTKLAEVRARAIETRQLFPVEHLIETMANYVWINHNDITCLDVNDDDSPYPNKKQLAYRHHANIRFCRDFHFLDAANKAALIFHEIVYAALSQKSVLLDFVGYTFSHDFADFSRPSRREFSRLTDQLYSVFAGRPDYVLLYKEGDINEGLREGWGSSEAVCFGRTLDREGDGYALWEESQDGTCATRFLKIGGNLIPLDVRGRDIYLADLVVGQISESPFTLDHLCSGPYTALCFVAFDLSWRISQVIDAPDMHSAARNGALDRVAHLVMSGVDIDALDEHLNTPLNIATQYNQTEVALWLIENGADFHKANDDGNWPTQFALSRRNPRIVEALAVAGADLNTNNPLARFLYNGADEVELYRDMVRAILQSETVDPNQQTNLDNALKNSPFMILEAFVEYGLPRGLRINDQCAVTTAVTRRNPQMIRMFLAIPEVDANKCNPLIVALTPYSSITPSMIVVETLLASDRIDVDGNQNATPLSAAFNTGIPAFFDVVLNANPDLEVRMHSSDRFYTVFHQVLKRGGLEAARKLIAAGADHTALYQNRLGIGNAFIPALLGNFFDPDLYDYLLSLGVPLLPDDASLLNPSCAVTLDGFTSHRAEKLHWLSERGVECQG